MGLNPNEVTVKYKKMNKETAYTATLEKIREVAKRTDQRFLEINFPEDLDEDCAIFIVEKLSKRNFTVIIIEPYLIKVYW